MPKIKTTSSDIVWNFVGTIVSMASGFVLLPLLLLFLSDKELGLWYVFIAISNLAMLFEFGFHPTFSRNIVYVVSGVRNLSKEGVNTSSAQHGVDWHLLNVTVRTSKIIYACIGLGVLLVLATLGTAYVSYIAVGIDARSVWVSWILFCIAIFLNLYFLYSITVLRGYGDVAGENRAKTFSKVVQLITSGILLALGAGLIGAAAGYLINAVLMRFFAVLRIRSHKSLEEGRATDHKKITRQESLDLLKTVGHVAWRDGAVQLACYASTQAISIMSSIFLGLTETGTFSVLLQLATAAYSFAAAYPKTFYPALQAAFTEENKEKQREIASSGIFAYWVLFSASILAICLVALPILPLFKSGFIIDYKLFIGLAIYLGLWSQHSIFCNYIVSMNEVPYMRGYIVAAIFGIVFVYLLAGIAGWGAWGIVVGQILSQIIYNNWRWPQYLCRKIGTTYFSLVGDGANYWLSKFERKEFSNFTRSSRN